MSAIGSLLRVRCAGVLLASALVVACRSATDPLPIKLTVQRDTIAASLQTAGSVEWIDFEIPAVLDAPSGSRVAFHPCAVSLLDAQSGAVVWIPLCLASGQTPTERTPVVVRVIAALSGPSAPKWENSNVAGQYRLKAWVLVDSARTVEVQSNPFALTTAF